MIVPTGLAYQQPSDNRSYLGIFSQHWNIAGCLPPLRWSCSIESFAHLWFLRYLHDIFLLSKKYSWNVRVRRCCGKVEWLWKRCGGTVVQERQSPQVCQPVLHRIHRDCARQSGRCVYHPEKEVQWWWCLPLPPLCRMKWKVRSGWNSWAPLHRHFDQWQKKYSLNSSFGFPVVDLNSFWSSKRSHQIG